LHIILKEPPIMIIEYQPGTYCNDINCINLNALTSLGAAEYMVEKYKLCRNCSAWNFYVWLRSKNWTISANLRAEVPPVIMAGKKPGFWNEPETEEASAFRTLFT